ncbi:hypothetical protein BS47DRAFT_1368499 [Hydnum rufescens UP504]|uniref:Uncharacterized protein n=1 Tax=Hydnum rufescens UP504 TaxID=1448309 RepID=A0A9P6AH47_9AGAM|nr:hypothetical protein BS47DRAFT_1368499 [Hydnum rufescens UP504]
MANPKKVELQLSPTLLSPSTTTHETVQPQIESSNRLKPSPEPPPGLLHHMKLNPDTTELTLVVPLLNRVDTSRGVATPPKNINAEGLASPVWTRLGPGSSHSPDSTASSLTGTAWKPGHPTQCDYEDSQSNEPRQVLKGPPLSSNSTGFLCHDYYMPTSWGTPQDSHRDNGLVLSMSNERTRSVTNKSLTNEDSTDQGLLCHRALLVLVVESIQCEQGPSTAADCSQILQDTAAEVAKHYFLSDPDPYKFDPRGVLAVHMGMGVSSEDKVLQLAALAL